MNNGRMAVTEITLQTNIWRNDMETFSELLALCLGCQPATGGLHLQRVINADYGVIFDVIYDKLNKQWSCMIYRTPWRLCNVTGISKFDTWIRFDLWPIKFSASECKRYICNISSHWLRFAQPQSENGLSFACKLHSTTTFLIVGTTENIFLIKNDGLWSLIFSGKYYSTDDE